MISYINESYLLCACMPTKGFKEKLFEDGTRYAKSDNTIQIGLYERILHVKFERKISVSKSNLLYSILWSICI